MRSLLSKWDFLCVNLFSALAKSLFKAFHNQKILYKNRGTKIRLMMVRTASLSIHCTMGTNAGLFPGFFGTFG